MCCGTVYEAASYRGISLSKDMALIYKVLRIASQRVFSEGWAWLVPPLPALSSLSPLFLERVDLPRENKINGFRSTGQELTVVGPGPTLHSKTPKAHSEYRDASSGGRSVLHTAVNQQNFSTVVKKGLAHRAAPRHKQPSAIHTPHRHPSATEVPAARVDRSASDNLFRQGKVRGQSRAS